MNDSALQEIEIFFEPLKTLGLPNKIFFVLFYILGTTALFISFLYAVFLGVILYPLLSAMHKDDYNALNVWIRFISRRIIKISPFTNNLTNYRIK